MKTKIVRGVHLLLAATALSTLASCAAGVADRTEDRYDRRENRYDRRTYSGPGDHLENRYDRREGVYDKTRRW
jgi:hypothetical protein